jgi:hypothetical protein
VKTLLISGSAAVPGELRDIIARGSTSLEERRPSDVQSPLAADRVVFWAMRTDRELHELARRCARREAADKTEKIVFVASDAQDAVEGLSDTEFFVWPRDEDRLKMAFMTSA